jgi:succinate dehydrogenase (ubiquinone) cytochrome b560 subunit
MAAASRGLAAATRLSQSAAEPSQAVVTQVRAFATVPEFFGKESHYTSGAGFLGVPENQRDLLSKRPVSPHVFEVDTPTKFHYKMPINAISSIANRVTGFALSATTVGAGALALNGDLLPVVDFVRDSFLVYPARAVVAGPLLYHYVAGLRHLAWDHAKYGMQSEKGDLLDPKIVDQTSYAAIGVAAAGTLVATVASF